VKGTPLNLYRSHGCKKCGNIGYKGRMGIHEVMRMSENLERLTVENSSSDELMRAAVSEVCSPCETMGSPRCYWARHRSRRS